MAQRKASVASQSAASMLTSAGRNASADICSCSLEDFVLVPPAAPTTATAMASTQAPRRGVLRYLGPVDFADGLWAGVELVGTLGRNDGSVKGKRYFPCLPGQGLFVRPDTVQPFVGNSKMSSDAPDNSGDASKRQAPQLHTSGSDASSANLQKSLDAAVTRTIELEMEVDDLNTQLTQLRKAEPAHTATSSSPPLTVSGRIELEMEVTSLKDELDAAQRALRTAEATIQQLRQASTTSSPQTPPAVDTGGMAAQLKQKSAECDWLRTALSQAREEAAELARVLPHGDSAATALTGQPLPVVAADVSELEQKVRELEADKQQLVADMETLWREAAEAEASAAIKLESVTTAHAQSAQEWQREREQLVSAQQSNMARIAELRAQLEKQADDHATAAVDVEARHLRRQQEWEATLEKIEGERREMQDILELTEHELMEEKKQTDQLSELVTRLRDEAHARADARTDQLSAVEVQAQRQSQDLLESQRHVQTLQAQLQAALAQSKVAARHGSGALDEGQGASATAHSHASAEIDTLKLRVFQLEKENAVADQLRARFDALSKELAAVKSEGRQKLEKECSERKAEQVKAAEALAVVRKEKDALQSLLDSDKANEAQRSHALLHAALHGSLDGMERRSYQQLLLRSLTPTASTHAVPSPRTTMADAAVIDPIEMTVDQGDSSPVESVLAAFSASVRQWREEAAETGCVGGVLDFTTREASRHSVQVLFSA